MQLPENTFQLLSKLQSNLSRLIQGVGGFKHTQWRSFSERRAHEARGFIDGVALSWRAHVGEIGDLVERVLDLPAETVNEAVNGIGATSEEILLLVDELSRLH